MSHAVNDEILETLHEEVVTEWIESLSCFAEVIGRPIEEEDLYEAGVEAEVMKRFEAMS